MKRGLLIGVCLLFPMPAFAQINCAKQGKAELAKHNYTSAISWFTEAIRRHEGSPEVYYLRGKAFQEGKGLLTEAIADYSIAIRMNPVFFDAYLDRARAYEAREEIDRALSDCNHVVYQTSTNAEAYLLRGHLRLLKAQPDQASADCGEAIRLQPNDARPYRLRAEAFRALGKLEDAASDERRAEELSR